MEHEKKKNDTTARNQNRPSALVLILILAMMVGFALIVIMLLTPSPYQVFQKTATAIVATNDAVATLLEQTSVAATEQFILTNTALP